MLGLCSLCEYSAHQGTDKDTLKFQLGKKEKDRERERERMNLWEKQSNIELSNYYLDC